MKNIFTLSILLLLIACGSVKSDTTNYPKNHEDARREARGKITGEDGLNLFGGDKKEDDSDGAGLGVNSFMWRATLDTLSFLPITQADPFGGTVVTDWYEDPNAQGERFKINAYILSDKLRSDGIRISVFKQKLDEKLGWRDEKVAESTASDLEDAILTRARQLRIAQTGK
jgi:hypothetical protein